VKRALLAFALLLAVAAGLALARWPLVTAVETGATAQYPDLQPWSYPAGEEEVRRAATRAVERIRGWRFVGSGRGPSGVELRAVHTNPLPWFEQDVVARMRARGGRTEVHVRSSSRRALWDLGQNARNIRGFKAALDAQLAAR
jgi:hypothetical protein